MMTMDALTVAVVPLAGAETETIVARWGDDADPTPDRRHGTEAGRRRASVARALLRGVLEDMTGVHGRDWQFSANEDGKPFARLSCGTEGPAVSISHSGEFVAVGATALGLFERRTPGAKA